MKPRRTLVGFLTVQLLLFTSSPVLCADETLSFSKYRLMLKSGEHLEGRGVTITGTRLIARRSDGQDLELPVSDIRWLDYSTGTKARRGALVGMASAVVLFVAARGWESEQDNGPYGPGFGGLILLGIGAGVGALIGSRVTQWERAIGELNADSEHASVSIGVSF